MPGLLTLSSYLEGDDYLKWCEDNLVIVVQIETVEAVEKIDEIASVPGITACYIGPVDLMLSMGYTDFKDMAPGSEHDKAMVHVAEACKKHGVASGCFGMGVENTNYRISQGFQFINCGADSGHMVQASTAAFGELKI